MSTLKGCVGIAVLLVAVAGCGSAARKVDLPDGGTGYSMACDDSRTWDKCLADLGEVCGDTGFEIVSRKATGGEETGTLPTPPNVAGTYPRPYSHRTIVIKCI